MEIHENPKNEEVIINGIKIEGFIDENKCDKCDKFLVYFALYDSFFCAYCNKWKEGKCSDVECFYCKDRPDLPLKLDK